MNPPGLRERKKQKTRWAIQAHALRLFGEQGYEQTTVDQIAEAAEVSPSTFFRYYKTKEDVVLEDEYDAPMLKALRAHPPGQPPLTALRQVMAQVFGDVTDEDMAHIRQRTLLLTTVPALRMRMLDQFGSGLTLLTVALAEYTGKSPDAFEIRMLSGAVVGVLISALYLWVEHDAEGSFLELMDRALAELESGLPV